AMAEARRRQVDVESILVDQYKVPKAELGLSLSQYYRCPFIEYDERIIPPPDLMRDLKLEYLRRNFWLPLRREDNAVVVLIDNPGIRMAIQVIVDAYKARASDIHSEPYGGQKDTVIRYRVDGTCSEYQKVPGAFRRALVTRIKIMAQLDIAERRKPQDGKIRFKMPDSREIELRVATVPTANQNEDVVMRILTASEPMPLDKLGMTERNLTEIKKIAVKPYGLVLCVGPTGSGKTTTLHSILGYINKPERKIWTAEDPVEITQ